MSEITIAGHLTIDEIVRGGKSTRLMGGVTCYAALAARRLGSKVKIVSRVGGDFPGEYLEILRKAGVDISGVVVEPASRSTFFQLNYLNGERFLKLMSRAKDLSLKMLEGDAVYLGPVAWEISLNDIREVAERCGLTVLDPQGLLRLRGEDGSIMLRKIDLHVPSLWALRISREEAEVLAAGKEPGQILKNLTRIGARNVILTLGKKGAIISHGSNRIKVPSFEAVEVDSTGAGDVFGGAFLAEYVRSRDIGWAAAMGSAMASILVEGPGFYPLLADDIPETARRRAEVIYDSIEEF